MFQLCVLHSVMCKKPENVVDVIQRLKEQLPPQQDEGSLLFIDIRRDFVLQDALREGRKAKFTTNKHLWVSVLYPIYYVFFLGQFMNSLDVQHSVYSFLY